MLMFTGFSDAEFGSRGPQPGLKVDPFSKVEFTKTLFKACTCLKTVLHAKHMVLMPCMPCNVCEALNYKHCDSSDTRF